MYVHGANLLQKERGNRKYADAEARAFLTEIRARYDRWKADNEELKGPLQIETKNDGMIIAQRVDLLNAYKDFIDQQKYAEKFDSRSNLHSSVLEEFMYYLFRDLVAEFSASALIGKSHTFKDIFFMPGTFGEMVANPHAMIERKDTDFAIGVKIQASLRCEGAPEAQAEQEAWDIPAVAIECKTYLDKTMLQDASTAAEQLKTRNPNALYIVVAEWLKLTSSVNLRKFKIDQIYVLRKQKNTDREFRYLEDYKKNPIYPDVLEHLFFVVRDYLKSPWLGGIEFGLDRGFLL